MLVNISSNLLLAYQSLGVVYGDVGTSPLYVYRSIFVGKLQNYQTSEAIFGAFSLIFWTITLIPLLKYVFVVLSADDNGEGMFIKDSKLINTYGTILIPDDVWPNF